MNQFNILRAKMINMGINCEYQVYPDYNMIKIEIEARAADDVNFLLNHLKKKDFKLDGYDVSFKAKSK